MIQIAEPVTLEKLSKVEREQLRKSLETDPTTWRKEWENIVGRFHDDFADTPEEEVTRDIAVHRISDETPNYPP